MTRITLPIILSAALITPLACAQQVQVEREVRGAPTQQSTTRIELDDDGETVGLSFTNGELTAAELNGEDIAVSRVRKVDGGYDILDGDGPDAKVLKHIPVEQNATEGAMREVRVSRDVQGAQSQESVVKGKKALALAQASQAMAADARVEAAKARAQARAQARAAHEDARVARGRAIATLDGALETPKSMIGVGLGSVDESLAYHLGIDGKKATLVTSVMDELPAKAAGIARFDVIVSVNGNAAVSPAELRAALKDLEPGAAVTLEVRRGAETKKVEVKAVTFDATKMSSVEPQVFSFDLADAAGFELPDGAMALQLIEGMEGEDGEFDMDEMELDGDSVMYFVGPDGKQREIRLPRMGSMQGMPQLRMKQAMPQVRAGVPIDQSSTDDRLRRLEEQLERLTRELEKANARTKPAQEL